MTRTLITVVAIGLLGAFLSACGGGNGNTGVTMTPTPPPVTKFETQFGGNFATAYQGVPNSEPKDVSAGDVIAVNPTAEPVDLPSS